MRYSKLVIGIILLIVVICLHLFGLMRLYPLFITSPLLFLAIYLIITTLFQRKTFRGFK